MAEEVESLSSSGMLSRLFGALRLWSAADESARESPESESPQRESAGPASSAQEGVMESVAAPLESAEPPAGRQKCPQSSAAPESGPDSNSPLQRSSSEDSDNPLSIFGLPTPTRGPKPQNTSNTEQEKPTKGKGKGKAKKGRQGRGRGDASEPRGPVKKPPMRTARDVISRIQWDRNLPEDYFDIGYLDRFLGVVEKPFASFTWGDLPWQEYDVLAIPQHRVQYFKYRGVKVWDKASRLDAVFGSAGTEEDIEAAMTRIDEEVERERERRAEEALELQAAREADPFAESSDEDEEDGVEISLQPALPVPAAGVPEEERSTHFLAVRVNDHELRAAAERVQSSVVRHDATLTACAMRPTLLHVTLCMLRIEGPEAVAAAGRCLHETIEDLEETLRADGDDRSLRMRGLKTFGARVLYSPVAPCSSFNVAVETLRTRMSAVSGVRVTNAFEYVPHMTLLKVSRPVARARRSKFIDAAGYAPLEREELGQQRFDNVNLCAIDADCALDGFYVTEASVVNF